VNSIGQTGAISARKSGDPSRGARTKDEWLKPLSGRGHLYNRGKRSSVDETELLRLLDPWLGSLVDRATWNLPRCHGDPTDLRQEAALALLKCWRVYQRRRLDLDQLELTTYAYLSVRGHVIECFRNRAQMSAAEKGLFVGFCSYEDAHIDETRGDTSGTLNRVSIDDCIDLNRALGELELWERRLLNLHFYSGLTLKEIGEMAGVTESRTCQLCRNVLSRLRYGMGLREA